MHRMSETTNKMFVEEAAANVSMSQTARNKYIYTFKFIQKASTNGWLVSYVAKV